MTTILNEVTLTTIDCGECGGTYAINERFRKQKYERGGFWTCPYCKCEWGYPKDETALARAEKAAKRAQELLEHERRETARQRERAAATERRLSAARSLLTKAKNRAANGVCPCCTRHFDNLQRHMQSKHPGYAKQEQA